MKFILKIDRLMKALKDIKRLNTATLEQIHWLI